MNTFIRSMLSGISIALGSAIYMKVGGTVGAVMFTFGLLTVIQFRLPLYTGTAGFLNVRSGGEWANMGVILLGNIAGCFLASFLFTEPLYHEAATRIIQIRIDAGYLNCLIRSTGCGLIITLIVKAARDKSILLTLFGIPLFILLGFYHSIADAAYLMFVTSDTILHYLPCYALIVLGNFIGCNLPRVFRYTEG